MQKEVRPGTLAVDLDGTLLRSDILFESFWSALGRDWRVPGRAARALLDGKAALKRYLASTADIDVATLPYDTAVIDRIREWRDSGGRTALVTASDQAIAERVAAHLDLFDEVHGSDGENNLKGEAKARFLTGRYGRAGYVYMGDSAADLPVWRDAAAALTVNAPESLRARAARAAKRVEHLGEATRPVGPYLKAIRPHQWMKNALVFLPMLAAHQLTAITLLQSVLAFVAFSLVASGVYVLNDLLDLAADRAHPRKRLRPFAAGRIPIGHGTWMAAGLLAGGGLVSLPLGGTFALVMLAYFVTTAAYSLHLKRRAVVDICTLAGLYTLRILAGCAATGIPPSVWLLAFSIFFFFSLAAVKRQAELVDGLDGTRGKISGRGYQVEDLPIISMAALSAGYVSVLIMALYLNSPAVVELYATPGALWGICCVLLYWITRIVMVTHRGHMHDDPVVFAIGDRISRICLAIILAFGLAGVML